MLVKKSSTAILSIAVVAGLLSGCGSSGGGSNAGGPLAKVEDFCTKCAQCYNQPNFSEGFCTPFVNTTNNSFDRLACNSGADTTQLANQNVTTSQVNAWTCADFDTTE